MYSNGRFYVNLIDNPSNITVGYMRTRVNGMPVERKASKFGSKWLVLEPIHCAKILFTAESFEEVVTYAKAYSEEWKLQTDRLNAIPSFFKKIEGMR